MLCGSDSDLSLHQCNWRSVLTKMFALLSFHVECCTAIFSPNKYEILKCDSNTNIDT